MADSYSLYTHSTDVDGTRQSMNSSEQEVRNSNGTINTLSSVALETNRAVYGASVEVIVTVDDVDYERQIEEKLTVNCEYDCKEIMVSEPRKLELNLLMGYKQKCPKYIQLINISSKNLNCLITTRILKL